MFEQFDCFEAIVYQTPSRPLVRVKRNYVCDFRHRVLIVFGNSLLDLVCWVVLFYYFIEIPSWDWAVFNLVFIA